MVDNYNGIVSNLVKRDKNCEIGINGEEKIKSGIYNLTHLEYNPKMKADGNQYLPAAIVQAFAAQNRMFAGLTCNKIKGGNKL